MSAGTLALLQLCDSLFPVGSFAHSDGLEAAVSDGRVSSPADFEAWLRAQLCVILAHADGPAVRDAMHAVRTDDLATVASIDEELYAMRPSASGREATRMQGGRLLTTWRHIHRSPGLERVMDARSHFTFPVAFAVVSETSGVGVVDALEGFFYTRLAASMSAAMRLMPLGQYEAHRQLADVLREVPARVARVAASADPPAAFSPGIDIASMQHRYVYSRLFRS
jgi:urease accessory protein